MNEDNFLKVAKEAAIEAGGIISKYFGKKHQYKFKSEDKSDFATQADLESEQKIIQILTKNFPDHNIIAEESGVVDKGSEYTWVIDPLDGTISFAAGMPYFAVSIGLLKANKPILGVIYQVLAKDLYWAQVNKGAYLNGKKIEVSKKDRLTVATMVLDFGHLKRREPKVNLYILLFKKAGYIYAVGSASLSLALVAKGVQDGSVIQAWIWDFAAGAVIVREAGGMVTDFEGNEPDWTKDRLNVMTSNGLIHNQILEALKR